MLQCYIVITDEGSSFDHSVVAENFPAPQKMQMSFVIYINEQKPALTQLY